VLPGPILIADEENDRLLIIDPRGRTMWKFPSPGDLAADESFKAPDDAFFTPNGRQIVATQEDDDVIRVIDVATHKIVYTYGSAGVAGSGPNRLHGPDGTVMMPSGDILSPDIKNCRIIVIPKGGHAISRQLGRTGTCVHRPPETFGSPNGVFPMSNGHYLVTEADGNWVDELDLSGRVAWSVQVPGVTYIYESNEISPNRYLTVDHANPGQALTFDRTGHVLWRFAPTGTQALNKPSLAIPLPNGDVMVCDKANHRVIVVDPRTDAIVWQYGHSSVAGSSPGYLKDPTGLDLYPPNSLLVANAATMGSVTP
jgi:DNA-binding beta-propeller fold protein YncE